MLNQKGFTIWFTGLTRAGKTTISNILHHRLQEKGVTNVEVLDGDDVTTHLSRGLGFTKEDTDNNILRIGWVAHLLTKHRIPNLVSAISPYRDVRGEVRQMVEHAGGKGSFVEVFVDCPIEVCEKRDTEGLYARARRGEIKHTPGIDWPYEPPHAPDVHLRTDKTAPEECVETILNHLKSKGLI